MVVTLEMLAQAGQRREPAPHGGRRRFLDFTHNALPGDDGAMVHLAQLLIGADGHRPPHRASARCPGERSPSRFHRRGARRHPRGRNLARQAEKQNHLVGAGFGAQQRHQRGCVKDDASHARPRCGGLSGSLRRDRRWPAPAWQNKPARQQAPCRGS